MVIFHYIPRGVLLNIYQVKNKYTITDIVFTPGSPLFTQNVCLVYGMFRLFENEQLSGSCALESPTRIIYTNQNEKTLWRISQSKEVD